VLQRAIGQAVRVSEQRLILMRHAKAEPPDGGADIDRPLTVRGHADAGAAGAWLVRSELLPDLVLCSPARRTRQTWHGVAVALAEAASPTVTYAPEIYTGAVGELLQLIRAVQASARTVLLIGHNPAISMLTASLAPSTADKNGMRTAGIAVHQPRVEWDRLGPGDAALLLRHTPRAE